MQCYVRCVLQVSMQCYVGVCCRYQRSVTWGVCCRYLAIRHPLRTMTWNTPRRALLISLIVCVIASAITLPNFAEKYIVVSVDAANVTRVDIRDTSLSLATSYTLGFSYLVQVLFTFLPLLVLSVFNSLLLRHVIRARRQRRLLADGISLHQQHEQNGITVTLIAVVLVFVVCQTPQAVLSLYKAHFVPPGQNIVEQRSHSWQHVQPACHDKRGVQLSAVLDIQQQVQVDVLRLLLSERRARSS
jgi:hypothetical protein